MPKATQVATELGSNPSRLAAQFQSSCSYLLWHIEERGSRQIKLGAGGKFREFKQGGLHLLGSVFVYLSALSIFEKAGTEKSLSGKCPSYFICLTLPLPIHYYGREMHVYDTIS